MIHRLHFRRTARALVHGFIFGSCLLAAPATFAVKEEADAGVSIKISPALGASSLAKWSGVVPLVYDPDRAPARFASEATVMDAIREAAAQWERVSGIRFVILGVDRNAPDDVEGAASQQDGAVRIAWDALDDLAGLARPAPTYDYARGHFVVRDGAVYLAEAATVWESTSLVSVLVHEIGHLLGLGHSDNPTSTMFANPYNYLPKPRADDIRAVQVLYGPPAVAIDPERPLADWIYRAPPVASAATTEYLFKTNQHTVSGNGAYFTANSTTISAVDKNTDDAAFIGMYGSVGNFNVDTAIDIAATRILVDPYGYVFSERAYDLKCSARSACVRPVAFASSRVMKTYPGIWKVYIVDKAKNHTLFATEIAVSSSPVFNRAPTARLSVAPGDTPTEARFKLVATDPEGDVVTVIWHPPGAIDRDDDQVFDADVRNAIVSGGQAAQTIDFGVTGTYTLFVELVDDKPRYAGAGRGFQTLLRVTVKLPITPEVPLEIASSHIPGTEATSPAVLALVARTAATQLRARNSLDGSDTAATGVAFGLGASGDQGATTGTTFTTGDNVVIAASVLPLATDIGKAADIFMVVRTTLNGVDSWTYKDSSGVYVPWRSVAIADLRPALKVASLKAAEAFEIFRGDLAAAQHRIYVGYRLQGGSVLFYTGQALNLNVTP